MKKLTPLVKEINSLEGETEKLSEEQIKQKTQKWKDELKDLSDEEQKKCLDKILPEAYATVREVAKRTLKQRAHDTQLIAGITLYQGNIAEQKTGEGKTLTATFPLYLNCLVGKGAHLVTPNDYLSRHGTGWMGPIYNYLGVSVGVIMQEKAYVFDPTYEGTEFQDEYARHLKPVLRRETYQCDVVYGTNHEFGFDYLRDNMARSFDDIVQTNPRGDFGVHHFAIVDEVDSILIDVARTPLIISTAHAQPTERYHEASRIVKTLLKGTDYEIDEKFRQVNLTDLGIRKVERMLGMENLYEQDFEMVHLIEQALSSQTLYHKDKDYVVKDGAVVIIDQFTGRLLPSNRFSHGLHQALEAKEGVPIRQESRTLAEISYQNYFRMYEKLAGMTGTALTEAEEFYKIYKLDVVAVPTNRPLVRKDQNDVVYKTESAKFSAVAEEISKRHEAGQPVLVGTTSVDKSQILHTLLERKKIPHKILNAKNHEQEALIIAQAGRRGAVTVSTNMAGRGVDIILGGDPATEATQKEVLEFGGLCVIGTERHESRRIDNQLRGRSGRQGDPGGSRFFVSLQDDLMRLFGGSKIENLMSRFGMDESVPIEAGLVSKAIENAQKKVEGFNFDRRKNVVEMDDVINEHRSVVYKLRRRILQASSGQSEYRDWFVQKISEFTDFDGGTWEKNEKRFGEDKWLMIFSQLSLPVIDLLWMEHLVDMDQLREGIGLRGYAQRDPMVEYKNEGHFRFEALVTRVYKDIAERLLRIEDARVVERGSQEDKARALSYTRGELESGVSDERSYIEASAEGGGAVAGVPGISGSPPSAGRYKVEEVKSGQPKVGRNEPCPCGSGKKFKNCHGKQP